MTDDFARGNYESRWRLLERVEEEADRLGKKAVYNAKGVEEEASGLPQRKANLQQALNCQDAQIWRRLKTQELHL